MSNPSSRFGMADISAKPVTARRALAGGRISVGAEVCTMLLAGTLPKGDALALAEVAGIQGAKLTPTLLPLCHPIALNRVVIHTRVDPSAEAVEVLALAEINERTGVEMEALTACNIALLTLWDLVKPVNPALRMDGIVLLYKSGGKSGEWRHPDGLSDWAESVLGMGHGD